MSLLERSAYYSERIAKPCENCNLILHYHQDAWRKRGVAACYNYTNKDFSHDAYWGLND